MYQEDVIKFINLPSGANRGAEVGLCWIEKISGGAGTLEVPVQGTLRVDAVADTTVTIGGVLAITVRAGQVELVNVGTGAPADGKTSVTVVIAGNAYVQQAREIERGRRNK